MLSVRLIFIYGSSLCFFNNNFSKVGKFYTVVNENAEGYTDYEGKYERYYVQIKL